VDKIPRGGQIASDRGHVFASKELAKLNIAMTREKATQIFERFPVSQISTEQAFKRVWNISCEAAISDWTRGRLMQPKRAAYAKVVRVGEAVTDFDLLAFDADVGDPMLSATVGASGNVQLQVLIETR
jgi:hypothetical protein